MFCLSTPQEERQNGAWSCLSGVTSVQFLVLILCDSLVRQSRWDHLEMQVGVSPSSQVSEPLPFGGRNKTRVK